MRLRAPALDDAEGVLAVLHARELADVGRAEYPLEMLRDEWRLSDVDLAADAVLAEVGEGRIVGYAMVRRPGSFAVVAPEYEGRGIGTQVLRWTEERERQLGRDRHRQWISAANESARALLVSAGYAHERSYWRMVRRFDGPVEPREPPAAYRLRTLDVEHDALEVHALDDEAFSGNADYAPETFEQFREEHLLAHDVDPGLSVVAVQGERIAGYLLTRRWHEQTVGFVDVLAVHPDHQRRGVASAMLGDAFAKFARAGLGEAQLGVASDNPRALSLYQRLGMSVLFRSDTYQRPVAALK
jgi:mycothiol synthase